MAGLEEASTKVEGAELTPLVEGEKATLRKEAPTVSSTETEEFRKALDIALGKGLASTNQQLSLQRAEANKFKAELELSKASESKIKEDLQAIEVELNRLVEERFEDDPEALKGYRNSRALEIREKRALLAEKEQQLKAAELEGLRWAIQMHGVAEKIQKEYNVPMEVLELCRSEEEMTKIAQAFPRVEKEGKEPKFDSAISSAVGLSDDDFERRFGSGELDATPSNLKRAKSIMDKRQKGG